MTPHERPGRKTLQGLLVVSVEQAVAAPYCACKLADAGARVIKVERPEGDFARGYDRTAKGESAYFVWLNRGKESVALDLKDPEDLAVLRRMIDRADVFIQNLAPGAAGRLGIGSQALREADPRLITLDISGYGEEGPYRDMKAYDLLIQAETGLAAITGHPAGPGRVGVSVCDIAAGMYGYMAVLEALLERAGSGCGKAIQVSLFDALADWMTVPLLQQSHGGQAPRRVGLNHPSIAPYGAYAAADGEVVVSIQNEREWHRFCVEVLERPDLAGDPRFADTSARVANRPALDAEIAAVWGRLERTEVVARLERAKIAYGRVNSLADLAGHPQLRRAVVATPAGDLDLVAPPARLVGEAVNLGSVPALDEQGAALRREFAAERGQAAAPRDAAAQGETVR
ncbi:CaiB/BaiF CoA transferase family protein [Algihabitans albus]|uniref:CaiB/BaiF CoA transferase family protein n=1 Tax=Algihabitans albus TaxID=2164067 RepID=UPI000E5D8642|nr:CaiB/BaiF CoA-transferase family protein [Algihabitans albus]